MQLLALADNLKPRGPQGITTAPTSLTSDKPTSLGRSVLLKEAEEVCASGERQRPVLVVCFKKEKGVGEILVPCKAAGRCENTQQGHSKFKCSPSGTGVGCSSGLVSQGLEFGSPEQQRPSTNLRKASPKAGNLPRSVLFSPRGFSIPRCHSHPYCKPRPASPLPRMQQTRGCW